MLNGDSMQGCAAIFLHGLADDDALELWRAFGVSGPRDLLLPLFRRFDNHPLLIQALAAEVARYRRSPGNFEDWRHNHPDFDPFSLPLANVKSHVLEFSLQGLSDSTRKVLQTIAAFGCRRATIRSLPCWLAKGRRRASESHASMSGSWM
jgi:hypothetical protein